MFTSPPLPRPVSPPLPVWSASTPCSTSLPCTPVSGHASWQSSPGRDSPCSTLLGSVETGFTTPASDKLLRSPEAPFVRVGKAATEPAPALAQIDREYAGKEKRATRSLEWETFVQPKCPEQTDSTSRIRYERRLGPTEVSYYLGSCGGRDEGGVNDMYLHIGFRADARSMTPSKILDAWSELVARHVLLSSSVRFVDYHNIRFSYDAPATPSEARQRAARHLSLLTGNTYHDILEDYLNGPRFLSDDRLAHLVISTPSGTFTSSEASTLDHANGSTEQEYDLFLFSTHFIGDGMALHSTANEFFAILAANPQVEGSVSAPDVENIAAALSDDLLHSSKVIPAGQISRARVLAPAMESKLVVPGRRGRLGWAAAKVEFAKEQAKLIGGHAFPRARLGPRRTIVPTCSWSTSDTSKILAACKRRGVTIAHAILALASIAFIRTVDDERRKPELPLMLYSALNVRPSLAKEAEPVDWYHIAIGYFNIILPSFVPGGRSIVDTFWHRCRSVKTQLARATTSPFLATRTALMALEREQRSIRFERADDEKRLRDLRGRLAGLGITGVEEVTETSMREPEGKAGPAEGAKKGLEAAQDESEAEAVPLEDKQVRVEAPSTALLGLSLLGNLDGIYKHGDFQGIKLHTLTTGSRQRPGAMLLFAYTFAGQLWVSLGYDANGFEPGVIERWRSALVAGIDVWLAKDDS